MKQEEWLAEFERAHGRPANQEEIQQVLVRLEVLKHKRHRIRP
mgnify:CR=1 FL=1